MDNIFNSADLKHRMENVIDAFKQELAGLRTGRASANLLDPIFIEAYGTKVPLSQVANVSVPEPRMLSVSVWDKAMVSAVDRAIRESSLNLNPILDGTLLRIPLPELNEERRKELVRIAHRYAEQARIALRHVRRDVIEDLRKKEKDSLINKDNVYQATEQVQKITDEMVTKIDVLLRDKEATIMQV